MVSGHDGIFCLNVKILEIAKFDRENFVFALEVMPLLFFSCIFSNHIQGIQKQGITDLLKTRPLSTRQHSDAWGSSTEIFPL